MIPSELNSPDCELEFLEILGKSLECINNLNNKYRKIVYLNVFEGYSISEISELLNENYDKVRMRCYRGKLKLIDLLVVDIFQTPH